MVVGVSLLAYGIYALAEDGNTEATNVGDKVQTETTNSTDVGVGLAIAGGITAAAGGVVFFTQPF